MTSRIIHHVLFIAATIVAAVHPVNAVTPFNETFSGTGGQTASGGATGFDVAGWTNLGNTGVFESNGFGEDVYQVSVTTEDPAAKHGIIRTLGTGGFTAELELSNVDLPNLAISGGMAVTDNGDDFIFLGVQKSGDYMVIFADGSEFPPGYIATPAIGPSFDRLTLRLEFVPEGTNGVFSAWYQVDETGPFTSLGTVDWDGKVNIDPTRTIEASLVNGLIGDGSAEFDRFTVVPEPTTPMLLAAGAVTVLLRRRTRVV